MPSTSHTPIRMTISRFAGTLAVGMSLFLSAMSGMHAQDLDQAAMVQPVPVSAVFRDPASFRQELDLASGSITIEAASNGGKSIQPKLWVAGENLVAQSATSEASALDIRFGSWRDVLREKMFIDTRDYSWMPVAVNMAALGNTKEVSRRIIDKLSDTSAPHSRPSSRPAC